MNNRRLNRRPLTTALSRFKSALTITAALGLASSAKAVDFNWDPAGNQSNSGGAGTWDTISLFWNDDALAPNVAWPNLSDSVAIFGGTGGLVTINTGVAGTGVTASGLTFNADLYAIASDEASELLTLAGATPTINVTTGTATISSVIAGAAGFTKTGAGTLTFNGAANTLVGQISVLNGTLGFGADNQLGDATNGILLNGGRLNYTGGADWDPAATRIITVGAGGGTLGSSVAIRITDAGQITGAGTLTRTGTGTTFALDIQQAQTGFTGNTVINSGVIELRNNSGLGNTAGQTVTVNTTGILDLGEDIAAGFGATILSHNVTLDGGTLSFSNRNGGTAAGNVSVGGAGGIVRLDDFHSVATTGRNRTGAITGILSGFDNLAITGKAAIPGTLIGQNADNLLVGSVMLTNPGNTFGGAFTVGPAAALRSVQSGGINALGSATVLLTSDPALHGPATLGLASKSTAAGANPGFFGRYYGNVPNLHTSNGGFVGGLDFGALPVTVAQSVASATFANLAFPAGVGPNQAAILYTGVLQISTPGSYQFSASSDDGTILYVDGQPVVVNDFPQGVTNRLGAITLDAGFHNIVLKFAQGGGGGELRVFDYRGPDTANLAVNVGSIAGTVTNDGAALFAPTSISQDVLFFGSGGDIDLGGANATSTGGITLNSNAGMRVTSITGFGTLTQSGPVSLNGSNTVTAGVNLKGAALAGVATTGSVGAAAATTLDSNSQDSSGADIVISGAITESALGSGITKDGPRRLTLTNAGNAFSGSVTVNAGTLAVTSASLPAASPVTINSVGTLLVSEVGTSSLANTLSGSGALRKEGAGTLSINTSNPLFTGPTTVIAGTLTGTGTLGSTVTINNGAAISSATGSTFTVGGLSLLFNGNAKFALGAPSLAPMINVANANSLSAVSAKVNLTNAGGLAGGSYRLIDYAGTALTTVQFAGFSVGSGPGGFFYGLVNNSVDTAIDLSVEAAAAVKTWTGAVNGAWDTTTANWSPSDYVSGEQVIFGDGPTNRTITGGAVTPQSIAVNSGAGNDYVIANNIGGTVAGGLTKSGASTLRLSGANTFTGPISVVGGTLRANVSSVTSGLGAGAVTLAGGTTLEFDPVASTSVNGLSARWFNGAQANNSARDWTATAGALTNTNTPPSPLDTIFNITNFPVSLPGAVGTFATPNYTNFGIEFTGKLKVDTAGRYAILQASDDGARVFVDGRLVSSNDGGHGVIEGASAIYLDAGLHDFRMEYAQSGGGGEIRLRWAGPGIPRQIIPTSNLFEPESSSVTGTSSNIVIGTPISVSGSTTVALNGSEFTGIQTGTLGLAPGSTLNVTGQTGKLFRAPVTIFTGSGSFTLNNSADVAVGRINDLGNAVTLVKQGSGRLILDYVATTPAATVTPGRTYEVQSGTLAAYASALTVVNPLNGATLNLDGGDFELNVLGTGANGNTTWTVPINVRQDARMTIVPGGTTTTMNGPISLSSGATLTLDTIGGTRGAVGGIGNQQVRPVMEMQGVISGAGGLALESNTLNGGQGASAATVRFNQNNTYTGLTTIAGYMHSQIEVELKGTATLLTTSGINEVGALTLNSSRLKIQNNSGGVVQNRINDSWPVNMNASALQITSPPATSINEVMETLNLASGQNLIFAETVPNANIFHNITWAGVNRTNRATLRIDQHNAAAPGQSNMGSLTATNGYRLKFTDSSGFNLVGGGGGGTDPNTSIIPWAWAQNGIANERMFVTYGANGLRPLDASEYITALGAAPAPTNSTENLRLSFAAATTIGDGLTHTVNSFLVNNTGAAALTLTLAAGTTVNVTSGALMITTGDATARVTTLAGGTIDFGAAEGIITPSRAVEHVISSVLAGSNGITISGDGRVRLASTANTFSGLITASQTPNNNTDALHLSVQADGSLGNADNDIRLDNATFRFNTAFTLNAQRTVTLGPEGGAFDIGTGTSTIAGQVTGPGALYKIRGNNLVLNNPANDFTGPTYAFAGNFTTNSGPQGDIYAMNSTGTVTFDQSFDGTYAGDIHGLASIVKSGFVTVTSTGTFDHVGTTTVTGGGLFVNGSILGSTTTVNSGTLGGDGSIAFNVVIGDNVGISDAFLEPGATFGTAGSLSTGNLSFGTDGEFTVDAFSLASYDQVNVTGSILLNNTPLSINPAPGLVPNDILFLMINDGADAVTGQFAGIAPATDFTVGAYTFQVSYNADSVGNTFNGGNDVALLVVIPEPGSAALLLGGLGSLIAMRRRRKA